MVGNLVNLTHETELIIIRMGKRIKEARVRRNIMLEELAGQVGISKSTLNSIENGKPTVSLGAYAATLTALNLVKDFEYIAIDKEGKQYYSDAYLYRRKRATRRREQAKSQLE